MMAFVKKYYSYIFWIILATLIYVISLNPNVVEQYYSSGIYLYLSSFLRLCFGWIKFSVGDVIYVIACICVLIKIGTFCWKVIKRKPVQWKKTAGKCFKLCLIFYVFFKMIWGLNYNRSGVAEQLNLNTKNYCKEELNVLIDDLIVKLNTTRKDIADSSIINFSVDSILLQTIKNYAQIKEEYPFLKYKNPSLKASLYSKAGNYFGFTGYYNPISGEAQVRNDVPAAILPMICCHEVAHQLGYASESEANFVGYLVSSSSPNPYFRYSAYLDIFSYATSQLGIKYAEDGDIKGFLNRSFQIKDCLNEAVKADRKLIKDFFEKEKSKMSDYSAILYDKYLKMNKQHSGMGSYDEVIGLILAHNATKKNYFFDFLLFD